MTEEEKFDFWKAVDAPPWVLAAADQTDMEAGKYLDGVIAAYKNLVESTPDVPLTATAMGFWTALKASDKVGLFFMGYVFATAVKRLADKGPSDA